jgi:hypothetical protein
MEFFFFQKKKQKALFRFAEYYTRALQNSAKPTLGGWRLAPRNYVSTHFIDAFCFFQKAKQKVLLVWQKDCQPIDVS